jgi:uncharacterized NAD(P)/FAD-binding protein YdhS
MKKVVIVGGGFCGTIVAVNLVRLTDAPLDVRLINHSYPLGRGVAYSTRHPEHLLNVVARNMSALADQPDHFVEWLGTRTEFSDKPPDALRECFVPRRVYGDYLQALLLWYARSYADGKKVRVDWLDAEVMDLEEHDDRIGVQISEDQILVADKVVLATGNPLPAPLPGIVLDHPCYFQNPWQGWEERLPSPTEDVVLVGTGLTMIDAFLVLMARGWQGRIYAVSRNGLLPQPHFKGIDYSAFPDEDPSTLGLDRLHRLICSHSERMKAAGINPAILVDRLRPFTQRVWQNFSLAEKQRFLREFRTPWNVTRHRIPQAIHEQLMAASASGKLEIVRGELRNLVKRDERLVATIAEVSGMEKEYQVGAVLNCTGPQESYANPPFSLLRNLLARGMISVDDLNMGIRVTSDFAVVDARGERSKTLMALGPLLKGSLWESTAVPELRNQAFRVAEAIVADMKHKRAAVRAVTDTYADVVEYSI